MKKMIFSLAAVGLLASCSQNEIQEMTEKSNEIKFSTLNDKVTKHANDNKSNYRVFAKLTGATGSATAWFMNEILKPGNDIDLNGDLFNKSTSDNIINENGTPSDRKFYWPSNKGWTLNFYGFAPHNAAVTPNFDQEKLPITYTVKTKTGIETADAQEDFTIAIPKTFNNIPVGNNVLNQFQHMLTKIMIVTPVLTEALTNAGYAIAYKTDGKPSLNVINVKGTIDATTAAAKDNPTTWTDLKDAAGDTASESSEKTTYTGANEYLILPQPAAGNQIVLPIVITKDGVVVFEGDVTYQFTATDIVDNQFLPGKNYGMNITIDGKSTTGPGGETIFGPEITFSSQVANWDEVTIEKPQPGQSANN